MDKNTETEEKKEMESEQATANNNEKKLTSNLNFTIMCTQNIC